MELGHPSPKSVDSLDGHGGEIASPVDDVMEGDHDDDDDVGARREERMQTPASKKRRTSPDRRGDGVASPALKKIRTLSKMT